MSTCCGAVRVLLYQDLSGPCAQIPPQVMADIT